MKIFFVLVCTCALLLIKKAHGSAIGAPFYPLKPEDLLEGDVKELEYWNKHYYRPKRTIGHALGSAGAIIQLKTAAIAGTKMKIIEIAKTSAGSVAGASAGASAGTQNAIGAVAKGSGGALLSSVGGVIQLKRGLQREVQKKIGETLKASTGAIVAASTGAGNAALGTVTGSANALHQIKTAAQRGLTNTIGTIASGSAKHITGASAASNNAVKQIKSAAINHILGASSGIAQASGNSLHSVKNSLISGIALGSAGVHNAATSITGALEGSANAIYQLKSAIISHIFSSSAKVASGASSGIQTKVKQVSGDIVAGGVDVANQLKTAVHAGTKQKLSQAASGLAGAITGAVGSASAGLGQITRGGITGTLNVVNQIKHEIAQETQKKIGQVVSASAAASGHITQSTGNAIQGSGSAVHQLKSALLSGLSHKVGKLASGSSSAIKKTTSSISGSAKAIEQLKNTLLTQISNNLGQIALGSAGAVSSASQQLHNTKYSISKHLTSKLTNVARGALSAATAASSASVQASIGGVKNLNHAALSTISGSANGVKQLKSAVLSHIGTKIRQIAQGSLTAATAASGQTQSVISGSATAIYKLKSAALSHVTNKLGQLSRGSSSASAGSVRTISHLKTAAISNVANASINTVKNINELKKGVVEQVQHEISNLAEASAERKKRSIPESIPDDLEERSYVADELPKRSESAWTSGPGSGSADIIGQIKTAVVAGLKQKLGQVAKGSAGAIAGASAGFSKGSSGGDDHYHYHHSSYEPSPHHHPADEHKTYNVWEIKKSVLNTLLQAVKAIKGGVLAIKGQLIKGSGYVVSGGGKLIAASGDKVTKLGKNIISNAIWVHPNKEHDTHSEYVSHPSGYTAPSGPPVYDAPSPPSGHGYESHYESHPSHYDKPSPNHAGLLILRRMPQTHDKYHSSHTNIDESVVPPFKPLAPTGPTFGTVVGKFFSASTSLSPSAPAPFNHADIHPYEHSNVAEDTHGYLNPPSPPHYEEPRNAPAPATFQAANQHFNANNNLPSPSATNYGVPLEDPLSYQNLNFNDHLGEASEVNEQTVKLTKGELNERLPIASSEILVSSDAPDGVQALKTSATLGPPLSNAFMSNSKSNQVNYLKNALFAEKEESNNNPLSNFLPQENDSLYLKSQEASNELLSSKESYMKFLENFPIRKVRPAGYYKSSSGQKTRTTRSQSKRPSSDVHVVKSVSYKLTPEGVTRLT